MFLAHLKTVAPSSVSVSVVAPGSDAQPVNRIAEHVQTTAVAPVATLPAKQRKPRAKPIEIIHVGNTETTTVETFSEYPQVESIETLQPLKGTGRRGDFVHNNQVMDERFRNVSTGWTKRVNDPSDKSVMTWDDAFQTLETERGETRDIIQDYDKLRVINDTAGVALLDDNGNRLTFTDSSLDQFSNMLKIGSVLPRRLLDGDNADRETLVAVIKNGLRKRQDKTGLIRLRNDGQVRAFLSEKYCILDNRWFLEVVRSIIPDGLVSHWRSESGDSVYFNVLIPDSMRAETDSDYGGMLACGNGETGSRKLSTCPSVFRAICMNGCIWDETKGTGIIERVHRGAIDLNALALRIRDNLTRQIPLLGNGIDAMLLTRSYTSNVDAIPAIGSVIRSLRIPGITKEYADVIVQGFNGQRSELSHVSAFDVLQGMTKAAQTLSAGMQETIERAAGSAMLWTADRWENVFRDAKTLSAEEIRNVFKSVS